MERCSYTHSKATGTATDTPGAGMGFTPPVWLPGDVMDLGIDGLGSQRQHVLGPR